MKDCNICSSIHHLLIDDAIFIDKLSIPDVIKYAATLGLTLSANDVNWHIADTSDYRIELLLELEKQRLKRNVPREEMSDLDEDATLRVELHKITRLIIAIDEELDDVNELIKEQLKHRIDNKTSVYKNDVEVDIKLNAPIQKVAQELQSSLLKERATLVKQRLELFFRLTPYVANTDETPQSWLEELNNIT